MSKKTCEMKLARLDQDLIREKAKGEIKVFVIQNEQQQQDILNKFNNEAKLILIKCY